MHRASRVVRSGNVIGIGTGTGTTGHRLMSKAAQYSRRIEKCSRCPGRARFVMPLGGDEVGAALPGGWRVPNIVAATRWVLAMLAPGPSVSRLSAEEGPPHGTASSQHRVSLEYAEIGLRTSCLNFYCASLSKGHEIGQQTLSPSLSHPIFTGETLPCSLHPRCNARADQLPCPRQICPAHPASSFAILCVDRHLPAARPVFLPSQHSRADTPLENIRHDRKGNLVDSPSAGDSDRRAFQHGLQPAI